MDVREKLVELIFSSLCRHIHKSCKLAENIADDLIANGVTVQDSKGVEIDPFNKWISVKDRLPGEEGLYLVAVVNDHERRYSKTAWYHGRENWFSNQKVTHWMPLPKPPKGE